VETKGSAQLLADLDVAKGQVEALRDVDLLPLRLRQLSLLQYHLPSSPKKYRHI